MKNFLLILLTVISISAGAQSFGKTLGPLSNSNIDTTHTPTGVVTQPRLRQIIDSLAPLLGGSISWGGINGTLSNQTDVQEAIDAKLSPNGNGSLLTNLTASQVGLGNVTNESKATMFASPTFTGTITLPAGSISNAALANSAVANLSGTNTGDNAANTTYANDYRAANFVAGTNYLAPNGSAASLTNNNGGWTTLRVSGSNATTTGQVLVDVTGLVSGTLSNATLYEVEAVLYVTTSAVTTGTQYAIAAGGTGGASEVFMQVTGTTTTNAATTVTQAASATQIGTFLTTSSASGIITFKGFVLTRGSGTANISLQHLKITSGTSTVKIGSVLRYRLAQ